MAQGPCKPSRFPAAAAVVVGDTLLDSRATGAVLRCVAIATGTPGGARPIPGVSITAMHNRHRATLRAIFTDPAPAGLEWAAVEALLAALGADVTEGNGSRVRVVLAGVRAVFHRPHPQKEARRYQVRAVRDYLRQAGIEP